MKVDIYNKRSPYSMLLLFACLFIIFKNSYSYLKTNKKSPLETNIAIKFKCDSYYKSNIQSEINFYEVISYLQSGILISFSKFNCKNIKYSKNNSENIKFNEIEIFFEDIVGCIDEQGNSSKSSYKPFKINGSIKLIKRIPINITLLEKAFEKLRYKLGYKTPIYENYYVIHKSNFLKIDKITFYKNAKDANVALINLLKSIELRIKLPKTYENLGLIEESIKDKNYYVDLIKNIYYDAVYSNLGCKNNRNEKIKPLFKYIIDKKVCQK